ncbi:hypothetical protein [Micromonospora sp. HUAS LYJ1]|uniref:hypothetical protein n=1 Tax=Micromonospora sp. HUAS LYJ1 TaxID=3061626 RepID=UPI0026720010|nr:hypothetical protein [Micromonospora sp. HUAS LYJ1]WKU03738.1 hypothetical protein Q2K16_23280 [Micromonospora sp. HUAS LYJ1]
MTQDYGLAGHETRLVVEWVKKQPALRAAIAEAEQVEPDIDFASFLSGLNNRDLAWPTSTEEGRAVLVWRLMQHIADDDAKHGSNGRAVPHMAFATGERNLNDGWRKFVEVALAPFFDYLSERVGEESSVLYVLERYVRRVEWFDREELYARFQQDTRNGEEVYNLDLQRFLYLEGNYVTHAKPRSASGEADIIGEVDSDDALICDGKIFDAGSRSKGYLAKGYNQIVQYAQDYQKSVAYLVVFNISGRPLQFPTDESKGVSFPYVDMSGVRVYLVGVRALPPKATASKLGKATPVVVTTEDLINPDVS